MKVIVAGMGVQGKKRAAVAAGDVAATVDPVSPDADYKRVEDVPLDQYGAALVCTPDQAKIELLRYLLDNGKHVLVEKPLVAQSSSELTQLKQIAAKRGVGCYTAYNHRFEPNVVRLKQFLDDTGLGEIYLARLFYGNGTAADVRSSPWRDKGIGVPGDLGSHLLDLVDMLLGRPQSDMQIWSVNQLENRSCDHALFGYSGRPVIKMETTLLAWRNSFYIELFGKTGSAHLQGLCKWGPSTLTIRKRIFPSGKPTEESFVVEQPDPTWRAEYAYFRDIVCQQSTTNLDTDCWINDTLHAFQNEGAKWAA